MNVTLFNAVAFADGYFADGNKNKREERSLMNCPLCCASGWLQNAEGPGYREYICRRCGTFRLATSFQPTAIPENLKASLSCAARTASNRADPIILASDTISPLAAPHQSLTVSQRLDATLKYVASKCSGPGDVAQINGDDEYPGAECRSLKEFETFLEYLTQKQMLQRLQNTRWGPTIDGWRELDPQPITGGDPGLCFVAMWFDATLDDVYVNGFDPAIRACGVRAYRVKEDPTNKAVIDQIFAGIRRAGFVVADFTGQRQSVYYEAGFATGLGREVISCCRADCVTDLTFDTRHLGHIVWTDADDLRTKLIASIQANIIPKR